MRFISTTAFCIALTASTLTYAQPGSLDGDFDANGSVITSITESYDRAIAVVVQPDGKIVVTGTSGGLIDTDPTKFATVRYQSDGSLDPLFGTNGIVETDFGAQDQASSIALQSDGKIIAAGTSAGIIAIEAFVLIRYNEDGTVDDTFSTTNSDGVILGPFGNCNSIAIQSDGKIVAGGSVNSSFTEFRLARYNTDGTVDQTFGTNGVTTTNIGDGSDIIRSIAIQPDGKIVASGVSINGTDIDFALARYNTDGTLDNGFSNNGIVTTDFGILTDFENVADVARSVIVLPSGKILAVGSSLFLANPLGFSIARYNSDGTLDNSFGTNGKVLTTINAYISAAILQPDGKIIAVGTEPTSSGGHFLVLRYLEDGSLDPGFGDEGKASVQINNGNSGSTNAALQPNGRIVLVGSTRLNSGPTDFAVARFLSGLNLGVISFTRQDNGLLIYPNPIAESATLEYTLQQKETISIDLYDMSGKLVQTFITNERRRAGSHQETLVLNPDLSHGSYILTLSNGVGRSIVRITK